MHLNQKQILIWLLWGIIGGILGFAYYYFIGCNSGHCPLTSNWKITTAYGFFSGLVVGFPTKKKQNSSKEKGIK
ncbi:MAG: DUF6132 family protein [Candidatus Kapaibacteriota bacterium]